jgi:hypothetical protein
MDYLNIKNWNIEYYIALLIGLGTAALFILIEKLLITNHTYIIDPMARVIYALGIYRERKLTHTHN